MGPDGRRADQTTITRTQRVLSCAFCARRKIKCDRMFPCANCARLSVDCVPLATLPTRPRRRRFPERELLDRVRHYESLLRRNNVSFEPLHPDGDGEPNVPASSHETPADPVDFFQAVGVLSLDPNEEHKEHNDPYSQTATAKPQWYESNDYLLFFGPPNPGFQMSAFHPSQAHIFKLWQVYLDNVSPLLKVTNSATLQSRIVAAVNASGNISSPLGALMFSIYCVAVASLTDDECHSFFGNSRHDLLLRYAFACRFTLLGCNFLQSDDIDCLTAMHLYFIAVRPLVDPRGLAVLQVGVIRMAKRMNMHEEASYASLGALDAEMRRRLWWSLVLFDHRLSEMSAYKDTSLSPTWTVAPPHNINDQDLRQELKTLPPIESKPSDSVFAVVRAEHCDGLRHSNFHINFINPSLADITRPTTDDMGLLEKSLDQRYLSRCDPDNALHFMTIWTTKGMVSRNRLLRHYSIRAASQHCVTAGDKDDASRNALMMLDADTKIRANPLTRGFFWFLDMYVPAIALNHLLHYLKSNPDGKFVDEAWGAMTANYDARHALAIADVHGGLDTWAPLVLHIWDIREALLKERGEDIEPPGIVQNMRRTRKTEPIPQDAEVLEGYQPDLDLPSMLSVDASQFWNASGWLTEPEL